MELDVYGVAARFVLDARMDEESVLLNLECPDAGDWIREFLVDLGRVIELRRARRRLREGIRDEEKAQESGQGD